MSESEIEQAIRTVRNVEPDGAPRHYADAAHALANVVERAVEWFADVDLVYPSQTEQAIRNALREILEGPDE